MIHVTVNKEAYEFPKGTPLLEMVKEIQSKNPESYPYDVYLAIVDNRLRELSYVPEEDCEVTFMTSADRNGVRAYRRSLILLMEAAADNLFADSNVDIRVIHSIGSGYFCRVLTDDIHPRAYCELNCDESVYTEEIPAYKPYEVTEDFLNRLAQEMKALAEKDIPIAKTSESTEQVRRMFHHQGLLDKEKMLEYRMNSSTNIYEINGYRDYFYGYMVPSTGYLKLFNLIPFEDGFVLQYPTRTPGKIPQFRPSMKLFSVLESSGNWSSKMHIPTVGALNSAIAEGRSRNIILTQEALMEEQLGTMAQRIIENNKRCIMIAGPSSSGKTTFSHRLSVQLMARGVVPHPLPLDSYYRGRALVPVDENGEKNFEALEALDVELFNENVTDLLAGKRVLLPDYNFITGQREYNEKYMQLGENDVLVIEGIHGLNNDLSYSIPPELKYKIYISALTQLDLDEHNHLATTDGRLIRRIVRDARCRGTSAGDTIAMWDSVRRGEEEYIFPHQEMADEMFNSALIYEMSVLKIYAQPLLYSVEKDRPEYAEAMRLLKLLEYFLPMPTEDIANNSLIREFIGGGCFGL